MKDIVRSLSSKGFMHIFSASLINKIVSFGTSFIVVRILSKEAYGAWAYAMNILNFFLLVEGLGVVPGLLQYASLSNTRNEKTSFLKLAFLIGLVSNLIVAIGILLFTCYFELPIKGSAEILRMLSFFPVISIMVNIFQVFLRADFRHKSFSYLTVFNTVVFMICVIVGGLLYEVKGMVFGKYISVILSIFISIFILRDYLTLLKAKLPDLHIIKEFLVFSLISVFNNAVSSILYLLDTFLIGLMIKSETIIASYKTATLIPFALNFIPSAIMTFAYPYFAKNFNNKDYIKKNYRLILKYSFIMNSIISSLLIIFAPFVIPTIFGDQYIDSLVPFRILSFGFLIAGTFRIPAGNILASLKKIKVNFYCTLLSGVLNIILDIFFIRHFGSTGAAVATVIIFIFSSMISNIALKLYLK